MIEVKKAMLEVFRDAEYSKLHPEVRQQFEIAIVRLEAMEHSIAKLLAMHTNEFKRSQQSYWLPGTKQEGMWLTRQSDRYEKAYNSRDPNGGDEAYTR